MDYGHEQTDKELKRLEKKITEEYEKAYKEVKKKADDYFAQFKKEDADKQKLLNAGLISQKEYEAWRKSRMLAGKWYKGMVETLAKDLSNADKIAASMIGEYLPDIYALNANYAAFAVSKKLGINLSWTLYDHRTVLNLMKDDPQIIPKPSMDIPKDMRWNRQKIHSAITQGVLQGDSIPDISKRLRAVTNMDRTAAIRNARTYTTAAENKGRIDSYQWVKELGIDLQKEWMATPDGRTRDSHVDLDGERVEVDGTFSNGCRYPADPMGDPAEVYNCRCTLVAAVKGRQYHDSRFTRLPEGMTYEDWKIEHGNYNNISLPSFDERIKKIIKNANNSIEGITTEDIYKVGEIFSSEVNRHYKEIKDKYDKANARYDALLEKENLYRNQLEDINRAVNGEITLRSIGYSSMGEAEKAWDSIFDKLNELVGSKEFLDAQNAYFDAEKTISAGYLEHARYLRSQLAKIRPMGGMGFDIASHLNNSKSSVREDVEEAYMYYPRDWVKASINAGKLTPRATGRGYYSDYQKIIAISGYDKDSRMATSFHELGHRFEKTVDGILDKEKEFYERRTKNDKLEWLGSGYSMSEKTRKDNFVDSYMGKDYGGQAYELVSMGFEYAYTNPAELAKDPDMQKWVYGLLCTQ